MIGLLYTSVAFGTLVGPSIAGFIFDAAHSYVVPIIGSIAADIVAAVIGAIGANTAVQRRSKQGCLP